MQSNADVQSVADVESFADVQRIAVVQNIADVESIADVPNIAGACDDNTAVLLASAGLENDYSHNASTNSNDIKGKDVDIQVIVTRYCELCNIHERAEGNIIEGADPL